jgi:DNA-directed RNA polymerase specialized sigma24 family protein
MACCRWNVTEAEEVVQSAYLRVLEGQARYAGRSSFKTWLFSVVRTVAGEMRRRRWFREAALQHWLGGSAAGHTVPGPDEVMDSN